MRGARGRCPCQHPSDSGKAGETGCDACLDWNKPRRFRWVCPLLIPGEHGWHCSADAAQVRPFWFRAAMIFAGGVLALHVAVTGAVWMAFRGTGVDEIRWIDVGWPGRWEEIPKARARFFSVRVAKLLQETDLVGTELSLRSALTLEPNNYEAALFLGHLKQYQQNYANSDAVFRRLWDQFPDRRQQTALAWHDALLIRQRYPELAELCLRMAAIPSAESPAWLKTLLFSLRLGQNAPDFVQRNTDLIGGLPRATRTLILTEASLQRGPSRGAVNDLWESGSGVVNPVLILEYVGQLLRLNESRRATTFLRRAAPDLTAFDRVFCQMLIDQASGDAALVRIDYDELLKLPLTSSNLDRLAAWLIEHPDRRSYDRLERLLQDAGNRRVLLGGEMWVAALINDARTEALAWSQYSSRQFGLRLPRIETVDLLSDDMTVAATIPRIIATAGLPREVIFSLLQRSASAKRVRAEGAPTR